jgi:putative transposase
MKFTRIKLVETIRLLNEGGSKYQARKIAGVTKQRVYQVWNHYNDEGHIPVIGNNVGRPERPITDDEKLIVRETYDKYRVSASTLSKIILRDRGVRINHNRIHRILLDLGYAKKLRKIHVRKKQWIRYERRHSLTAVHIDWHLTPSGIWICAVVDDASRKLLAILETSSPTVEYSIKIMELALEHGCIQQCISDHGSQFTSNRDGESKFKSWLDAKGIQQILCRIKHPQSNGKVERWFETYETHRYAFKTLEEFSSWYNDLRPHRSLRFELLETPSQAFERKKKAEV